MPSTETSRLSPAAEANAVPVTATPVTPNPVLANSGVVLDVVIPVYNEAAGLEACVRRLHAHLVTGFPYPARITIADNASTDGTFAIATRLAADLSDVRAVHLPQKGRGRALRAVWSASDADVLAYMDVDLSTDLAALLPLVAPLITGHSDIAIGTRLARDARVVRGPKREIISRCYNLILRGTLAARFSDAQCGFKAIRRDVARELLPLIEDTGWFFDTELLVLAERADLRIHEVPVDWIDDPDSRVDIVATAKADLRGVVRLVRAFATGTIPLAAIREHLGRAPLEAAGGAGSVPGVPAGLPRQLVRFAVIGVTSTAAYLLLYLLLRLALPTIVANALALLVTTVANTAANRRFTFAANGPGVGRQQLQGLLVFGLGLALTTAALAALPAGASRAAELAVLVLANLVATALRFIAFRVWVFRPTHGS